ncbi:hypothetical protein RND81_10G009600 [Saponaria officinalis]|uniref:Uncharacterized protein n=1 Tax=Saponaria officinalis TaxID=3572 RepID=A0AAW1HZD8_SAPOF
MILHAMGVEGVTVSHVKSHLQMHRSMRQTTLIQEAIEAAKKSGKDTELIAKLPELIKTASRPVSRRQTRLQAIKTLLVKNALVRHFSHHRPQPPELEPMELGHNNYDGNITTIQMPGENEKRAYDYLGNKLRGKEKIINEEGSNNNGGCLQRNDSRKLEEFYKEVMNKCKSTNIMDSKLRLHMLCSPVILPPNHNNISLELTL